MKDHDIGFLELVQNSLKSVPECDVHQVKNKLDNSEEFFLVDFYLIHLFSDLLSQEKHLLNQNCEWVEGSIPNSIHIGKGVIERDIATLIPNKDAEIVLYCQGGFRSALAGESIQKMGYKNVFSMSGGYSDWVNNN